MFEAWLGHSHAMAFNISTDADTYKLVLGQVCYYVNFNLNATAWIVRAKAEVDPKSDTTVAARTNGQAT